MSFGMGLAGFASGLNNGMDTGSKLYGLIQQDELAKVRAQGVAEAQAAQAAATPQITDLGDRDNLTANPQQSVDPNAQPDPVNTSLTAAIQGANDRQSAPTDEARAAGIKTYAVDQPGAQGTDQLSSTPMASRAPGATSQPDDSNLDAAAKSGLAPLTPSKRFNVDGQGFDSQEEAAAYVKKNTPALESFYKDTLIPKMTATLIAQGKPDMAEAWEKYADQEQTRQTMATWGKAVKLAQLEDYGSAASELMKLHPHYQDGYDLISATPTKGDDGEDGFTMKVKAPDGSTQTIYQNAKSLTQMGLAQLSPIEMFQKQYEVQTKADQMEAKAGFDQQNDERTMKRALAVAGVQAGARQQVASTQVQGREAVAKMSNDGKDARQQAAIAAKLAQAREGWAAAAKRDAAKIAAQGQFRKAVSPEERRAMVVTHLSSDPMFNMLPPDQQKQRIEDTMALIPLPGKQAPASIQPATPMQNGLSQPAPQQSIPAPGGTAPAGKIAVQVFDPASGSIKTVYR